LIKIIKLIFIIYMSFLNGNNSEYLSARLTQSGRRAIAKGDFKISYFSIGDSEFVYTNPFSGLRVM